MWAVSKRNIGYKAGVALLFISTISFIVGFGAPFWSTRKLLNYNTGAIKMKISYHEGLWMMCVSVSVTTGFAHNSCGSHGFNTAETWFQTVRVLECLCLASLTVACIYALVVNCCRAVPGPRSRILEIVAGIGGVAGLVGAAVYAALCNGNGAYDEDSKENLISSYLETFESLLSSLTGLSLNRDLTFQWALFLIASGSFLSVSSALIVAVFNREILPSAPPSVTFAMPAEPAMQNGCDGGTGASAIGYPPPYAYPPLAYPPPDYPGTGYPDAASYPAAGYPTSAYPVPDYPTGKDVKLW